jgi:hypothetical protein
MPNSGFFPLVIFITNKLFFFKKKKKPLQKKKKGNISIPIYTLYKNHLRTKSKISPSQFYEQNFMQLTCFENVILFHMAKRYLNLNSYGKTCTVEVPFLLISRHLTALLVRWSGNCMQIQSMSESMSFAKSSIYQ